MILIAMIFAKSFRIYMLGVFSSANHDGSLRTSVAGTRV